MAVIRVGKRGPTSGQPDELPCCCHPAGILCYQALLAKNEQVGDFASNARDNEFAAIICGAGMAAHLVGVVSAHTTLPVIGVPLSGGISDGLDSLLSTVQMPRGIPATVAVNGLANAAVLAVEMLSITDAEPLAERLKTFRDEGAR